MGYSPLTERQLGLYFTRGERNRPKRMLGLSSLSGHAEMSTAVIRINDPGMKNAFTPEVADEIIRKEYVDSLK